MQNETLEMQELAGAILDDLLPERKDKFFKDLAHIEVLSVSRITKKITLKITLDNESEPFTFIMRPGYTLSLEAECVDCTEDRRIRR